MKNKNSILKAIVIKSYRSHCMTLFMIVLLLSSCEKDPFPNFALSTGKTVTLTRNVDGNFSKIILNDDVNLVLTQGSVYSISVEGGENILSGIETSVNDSTLTISNHNTFNWLRSYDKKITAYITLPHLLELDYKATSTVTNKDTIREDSLTVIASEGSGYIDLIIKTGTSKLSITGGSADLKVGGKTAVSYLYTGSYGPIRCLDLETDYLFMRSQSTNDSYVNVRYHFEYEISGLGNIYYKGNPPEISGSSTSSGKAIKYD